MNENRRARLYGYLPWILRDYFTNQGPSTAIVVLLVGFMTIMPVVQGPRGGDLDLGNLPESVASVLLRGLVPILAFIATFFATNGIIANDRKFGFYRFLFAKPVSPVSYYLVTFAAYGVGVIAVTCALLGVWSMVVRPAFPLEVLAVVGIMYIAYGGIGFVLSAAWRFDWLSLVTVLFAANVAWSTWGAATSPARILLYLLPPVHRAGDLYELVLRENWGPQPWSSIAWLAGYGALCLALGCVVIRHRPLGTN